MYRKPSFFFLFKHFLQFSKCIQQRLSYSTWILNQAHTRCRPVHIWFLVIALVHEVSVCVFVCMSVCAHVCLSTPMPSKTTDLKKLPIKQVLQLSSFFIIFMLLAVNIMEGHSLSNKMCHKSLLKEIMMILYYPFILLF